MCKVGWKVGRRVGGISLTVILLLAVTGCARLERPIQAQAALAPEALQDAKTEASLIVKALPSYRDDGLAVFEGPEIKTVEDDLVMIQGEEEGPLLVDEVKLLQTDWESLVALDAILQRESLI